MVGAVLLGGANMKFEVGQRVVRKDSVEKYFEGIKDDMTKGTVVSVVDLDQVVVKWDNSWANRGMPECINMDKLLSEEEGNAKASALEEEFKVWSDPIKEKLTQAGKLIEEASELSNKLGCELSDLWELTYPLLKSMDKVGWRTSSLSC